MSESKKVFRSCFIITPIGDLASSIRRSADGVILTVIKPVLLELEFKDIIAAHHITVPGSINKQVINHVIEDDLVIANLTGLNANVMYELAIRHATRKPIIQICEKSVTPHLPFDISDQRTIFYENDMYGVQTLKDELREFVKKTMQEDIVENPIYDAIKNKKILGDEKVDEPIKYILSRIDNLESKILSQLNEKDKNGKVNNLIIENRNKSRKSQYSFMLKNTNQDIDTVKLSKKMFNNLINNYPDVFPDEVLIEKSKNDVNSLIASFSIRDGIISANQLVKVIKSAFTNDIDVQIIYSYASQ
jgi:hypothetical protein